MAAKKKLTPFQRERAKAKRLKLKLIRDARRARLKARKDARKARKDAKRAARLAREQKVRENRAARREKRAAPKRAMKEWTRQVAEAAGHRCEVCGAEREPVLLPDGTQKISKTRVNVHGIEIEGRPVWRELDAHHLLDRVQYKEHRFDPKIGILCCKKHHKYGRKAVHKNAIWFSLWLARNKRSQFDYIVGLLGDLDQLD